MPFITTVMGQSTTVDVPEWPITIQKMPFITTVEQSTTVACTRVADYHPKNAVHYDRGAEYHGRCTRVADYHPKNTVHINTVVAEIGKYDVTNLINRYREEP